MDSQSKSVVQTFDFIQKTNKVDSLCANEENQIREAEKQLQAVDARSRQLLDSVMKLDSEIRIATSDRSRKECDLARMKIRVKIFQDRCKSLEESIQAEDSEITLCHRELRTLTHEHLKKTVDFAAVWNCTDVGVSARKQERQKIGHELMTEIARLEPKVIAYRMAYDRYKELEQRQRAQQSESEAVANEKAARKETLMAALAERKHRIAELKDQLRDNQSSFKEFEAKCLRDKITRIQTSISSLKMVIDNWTTLKKPGNENAAVGPNVKCGVGASKPAPISAGRSLKNPTAADESQGPRFTSINSQRKFQFHKKNATTGTPNRPVQKK